MTGASHHNSTLTRYPTVYMASPFPKEEWALESIKTDRYSQLIILLHN